MWWNFLVLVGGLASGAAYRLPGDVRPVHYDLAALYDLDPSTNFSYFAVVQILLTVVKPTSKIMLHAQDLLIDHRDISLKGYPISHVNLTKPSNLITIIMDTTLEENRNYTLTIPFYGHLDTGLRGVYISNYDDMMTKSKEYLVATQFEPISARKGFPCFDEPMYKATFRITLGHSRNYTAVSNMPLNKTSEDNAVEAYWPWSTVSQTFRKSQSDFVWDEFERSVPMSTYLVAFVISKFRNVESPAGQSTTKFRIWCRGDAIEQTSYAASVGPRVLDHFEKFFSIPFPLPKLDMFAIPDFSTGAMENWGLITYRETALLYDKQQSSFLNKDTVASVIAHELAHQWFGNLVTMKWWSDLWLNEGFATFMGSVGVAAVEPTWEADKVSAIDRMKNIYSIDSLESSHPVSVPLEDPNRIHEIFDRITYSKSAALVRMMTMFLGEDVFREAMHNYLLKYSYQNAEQDDLWAELTAVSQQHGGLSRDVTVKQVMDTWTTQAGYPLLTVTRDYTAKSLTIQQKRYLSLSTARSTSSWWVPLNVLCQSEALASARALQWLGKHEGVSALHRFEHGSGPDEWVLFNYDIIALCHVNYDKRNWELLSNTLTSEKYTSVPVLGRVQLLGDGFALAWSNQLDYTIVLQLASYLHRERDYLPVSTCLDALAKIEEMIKRTSDYGAFQKYVRSLIADMYHDAGGLAAKKILDVDNLIKVKMQVMTSEWACRMHVPSCENNAIDMFRSWMDQTNPDENNPIPLDLRPTVYCVSLSHGSVREWRFALERMQRANVAAAREQLLHALACTREVWLLSQFLEWAITEGSVVRRQDAHIVIVFITRSSVGYYVAKDFIYNRIADLHNTFKYGHGAQLGGIADMLTEQFTSQKELDEFQLWYANNTRFFEGAKLTVQQAIEKASDNIGWVERNRRQVVDKLREFSTSDDKLPIMRTMADQGEKMSACVALILVNVLITLPLC